jgi:hypothetical protein
MEMDKDPYLNLIVKELLPHIQLTSENRFDPIMVRNESKSWNTIGIGNYAGVFAHPSYPECVVKVYGRKPEELKNEIEVYKKLGRHEAFSTLLSASEHFLVLKRINGVTLFDSIVKGIPIPESVINDIDAGVEYARAVGLNPYDIHGKNVVMDQGRGYIVDVSDFYKNGYCPKWDDLKKAYYKIYRPLLLKYHPPIPFFIVEGIRKGYRLYRKFKKGNI